MNYKDILGSLKDSEADLLRECAKEAPLNKFLEIGTFVGKSASVIAEVAKERSGILVCIDYFPENQHYWGEPKVIIKSTKDEFLKNMHACGLLDNIISYRGNSTEFLEKMNGKFGMIYIDGGHTVKSVLQDALHCWQHLPDGGFLIFHDYDNKNWPDVQIVVDVLMKRWGVEPHKISESKNMIALKKCLL